MCCLGGLMCCLGGLMFFFFFWRAWNDSFPCVLQQVTSLDN